MYKDKAWLSRQYYDERLSTYEMARLADCTESTIRNWMDRFDLPRRTYSDAAFNLWRDNTYRTKMAEALAEAWKEGLFDGAHSTDHCRSRHVEIAKGLWNSGVIGSAQWRITQSAAIKKAWKRGAFDGVSLHPPNPSGLELSFADALERNEVELVRQYRIPGTSRPFDFYLPKFHLLVEIDGDYWHHSAWAINRSQPAKDEAKNILATENGYSVLRLRGSEVKATGLDIMVKRLFQALGGFRESADARLPLCRVEEWESLPAQVEGGNDGRTK